MILCSVELPVKYLNYSEHFDFDFIIASTCLEYPEYFEYYKKRLGNRLTILDNGAFETGEAISDDVYMTLARELQPDILVVPDVYGDNAATGCRAVNFMNMWKRQPIKNTELMGVLQGESWRILDAMYRVVYKPKCKYIGFPYATGVDRYQFLKAHPEIENVHILGLSVLTEVYGLLQLPNVMSIDSSLPVRCAAETELIDAALSSNSYVKPDETELDTLALSYNLQMFTAICRGESKITPIEE